MRGGQIGVTHLVMWQLHRGVMHCGGVAAATGRVVAAPRAQGVAT